MFDPASLGSGIMTGLVTTGVSNAMRPHEDHLAVIRHEITQIRQFLDMELRTGSHSTETELLSLSAYPQQFPVHSRGRRHTQLFSGSGSVSIQLEIPNLGTITYALNAGWNQLDMPDDTLLSLAPGATGTVNVLFRRTDTGV
jgi:hypothetical protein